jgi:hypothetical protein
MYAPGAGWHGNIIHQRLPGNFEQRLKNPVYQLFKSNNLASFVDKHIAPWHLHKGVLHCCTASALIARIAEEIHRKETNHNRPLTAEEMEELHRNIEGIIT